MISVVNVSKSFGPVRAIQNVSFEINPGEVVGFLGPNGAGKTTMMRMVTGFFPPSEGEILIDGKNLFHASHEHRRKIGYLPENNPLYRDMATHAFLNYAAQLKGIPYADIRRAVSKVIEQCGIESVSGRMIGQLSKGFQQRIGLAQALLGDPEVLVLDEPTNGLDPKQIIEIRTLIQVLGKERTILLSSHILPEVRMTCERILILNKGRLVASGTSDELEKNLRQSEELLVSVRGQIGNGEDFFKKVPDVLGVKLEREIGAECDYRILCRRGKDVRSELARLVLGAGFELLSLKAVEANLEEIFLQVVTNEKDQPS